MARVVQVPDIRKVDLLEARQAIPRPARCRPRCRTRLPYRPSAARAPAVPAGWAERA